MAVKNQNTKTNEVDPGFAFHKENYLFLIAGIVLIVVGFLLMLGGGSDDPKVFSEALFDFRRLTLAPILILAGFIVEIYAIMKRPKSSL
jgi:membrane-bound ClpP family serine protease